MRALQITAQETLEIRDVPVPQIGPDEVLVKVAGAGLCQSDLHVKHMPFFPFPGPLTLGHETSGHVAELGSGVEGLAEGDPVVVHLIWACGNCRACVEGRDNVCINSAGRHNYPPTPGLGPDGGMAEYIAVKARYLEPIGDLSPVTAAPLADAGMTPMHAINGARQHLTPGSTTVAIGLGGLGHMGLQILAATSATRIIALDTDEQKLAFAREHGADVALVSDADAAEKILELTGGYGADAVFDFVGVQSTVDLATKVIAPDGAVRFVGLGDGAFSYAADSVTDVLPWGVSVRRSFGGTRSDLRQVVELTKLGRINLETVEYSLDDGLKAFDDLEAGKIQGRAILVP